MPYSRDVLVKIERLAPFPFARRSLRDFAAINSGEGAHVVSLCFVEGNLIETLEGSAFGMWEGSLGDAHRPAFSVEGRPHLRRIGDRQ